MRSRAAPAGSDQTRFLEHVVEKKRDHRRRIELRSVRIILLVLSHAPAACLCRRGAVGGGAASICAVVLRASGGAARGTRRSGAPRPPLLPRTRSTTLWSRAVRVVGARAGRGGRQRRHCYHARTAFLRYFRLVSLVVCPRSAVYSSSPAFSLLHPARYHPAHNRWCHHQRPAI